MNAQDRQLVIELLREAFGPVVDVTPDADQPLHVLFESLELPHPWTSPARALARFTNWPADRPEFFVDITVVNSVGEPPRSNSIEVVLGASWRRFSFGFNWEEGEVDPVRAILLWQTRFRELT